MSLQDDALRYHIMGKIAISSRVVLKDAEDLSLAYTPGVAEPSSR